MVMFAAIFLFASVSFATVDQKEVTLADAIKILKTLTGSYPPPDHDVTGTWVVQSFQNDETRTGEAYLEMMPNGHVNGYAELTSLPGLSSISGVVHGVSFDLKLIADSGSMIVHGTISSDGQNISGTFSLGDNEDVFWEGQRMTEITYTGTYVHNAVENKLILDVDGNDIVTTYTITEFTETRIVTNHFMIWERITAGDAGSIVGTWENTDEDRTQTMILSDDGTFSITMISLP